MSSANQRHLSDSAQRKVNSTYTDAAHQYNEEWFHPASCADDPRKPHKQDDTKYVLDARKKHSHHCAQLPILYSTNLPVEFLNNKSDNRN